MAAAMAHSSASEFQCSRAPAGHFFSGVKNPAFQKCNQIGMRSKCFQIRASNQRLSAKPRLEAPSEDSNQFKQSNGIPYGLVTALSGLGAIETAYLTWIKFNGGTAVCPASGAGCNDVLNSVYSSVYGVPLSLIGLVSYSSISILGLTMLRSMFLEDDIRWVFLGGTSALAAASGYFIYLLNFKLEGASCTYCVVSALLSLSLFLCTLKGFRSKDVAQVAGLQLAVTVSVVLALSTAFASVDTAIAGLENIDLPPIEPEITTTSDATKISLAKHLKSIGAKMYGAFWCSHCHEQKQELGKEAVKILEYVECYPDGYRKGVEIASACKDAKIEGFPSWVIKGEKYSGELTLQELADAAGFKLDK